MWNLASRNVYESQHLLFTQVKAHIIRCESHTTTHSPTHTHTNNSSRIKYIEQISLQAQLLLACSREIASLLHIIYDMDIAVAVW